MWKTESLQGMWEDYDNFQRVHEANKKQLEAAYDRQQAKLHKLETL